MKLIIRSLIATYWLLNSPLLLAGFSTYSETWPDSAAVVNEKITSNQEKEVTKPDPNFLVVSDEAIEQRVDEYKRLYAKLGATLFTNAIRNINNTSYPALSSGSVVNKTMNKNDVSWEFALGTKFQYVRLELEYLYQKSLYYKASPLFYNITGTEALNSKLMNQSVWFNLNYDLKKLNVPWFTPYFGGSLGAAWNKTRTTLTGTIGNGVAQNHARLAIGWGATFGVRFPFWSRWFGYIGYKYLDHGKVVWQDATGVMQLKGHYVIQGFDMGVQYLLG